MKTTPHSAFRIPHSSPALLAALALGLSAWPARAQTGWGSALSFDGVDDYVQFGAVPLANSSFTIEAWARRDTTGTMDMIVAQGNGAAGRGLMFGYHWFGFDFDFYGDGVATTNIDNAWHHWAGTYNATNRVRCLYRDGVLMASNVAAQDFQGTGPLRIGGEPFDDPASFAGAIDDVRIWNVARSQADIAANLSAPLAGTEPNLLAYWKLDEGAGTTTADATTNGFNGVLVNGPSWTSSSVPQAPAGWATALSMDGTDDYVSATIPALASNYTFSAWVYLRVGGISGGGRNVVGVLSAASCGGSTELMVRGLTTSSTDPQYLELGRCGAFVGTLSTGTVALNQWVHIAVTVSSNKQVNYFVNGSPAGSWNAGALNLTLGPGITLGDNTVRQFNGALDEVQIWNRARTQTEIAADATHPLIGVEPGLVAYYRFDEGGGVSAYDATPNHRNGTLINRPVRVPCAVPPPPTIQLFGANPLTNEYQVPFADPGATAGAGPVSLSAQHHTVALNADGSVIGWGSNNYGESDAPPSATNGVAVISAGLFYNLALKTNGTVIGWGDNSWGQATIPANAASGAAAIAAGMSHSLVLKANGTVVAWGRYSEGETNVPASAASGVVAIAAAGYNSMALKADGSVVVWGDNSSGQATIPASAASGVVAIATGGNFSLALKANGSVVVWGDNYYGQTNVPAGASSGVVAIAAGLGHILALKGDGSVVAWGANEYGQANVPENATTGVVGIEAGVFHSLALKADGSVVAWGMASTTDNAVPRIARTLCPGLTTNGIVQVDVPGTYTLTYSVTNGFGIVGTANRTVFVLPDTTPPQLPAELVLTALSNSCHAALPVIAATDTSDPAPVVTCVPPVGSLLRLGRTNVVCTATDASGNSVTGAVQVIVIRPEQRLAPAGEILTLRQVNSSTMAVASSADGTRLVAAEWGGQIYLSADAGLTWTARETSRYWQAVASSADGRKLVAVEYYGPSGGGHIYTSSDYGLTWTPRESNRYWQSVASSADGTRLVAVGSDQIYTSADSGTNWTAITTPGTAWSCVVSSADGMKLVAIDQNGGLHTSTDYGLTWIQRVSGAYFVAVAASADATKLVAVQPEGGISTSTNSGVSWTSHPVSGMWQAVASSADGAKLVALAESGGDVYTSSDSGATWTGGPTTARWSSAALSADGNRLVAGTSEGQIYTSVQAAVPPPAPMTFSGAADLVVDLAGPGGTVVTFTVTATSTNECEPSAPVVCTPPSGSTFPAGTTLVTCVAVDAYGLTYTTNFTVAVRGIEPPTDIALAPSATPENQPPGTTVGTLNATDTEPGDAHSFALVSGAGDADNAWFTIAGHSLRTAAVLDYEVKNSYSIRVRAVDSGGLSVEKPFTITVTDANDAPVLDSTKAPTLTFVRIGAGAPAGAVGTAVTNLVDIGGPLSNVTDEDVGGAVTGVAIVGADADYGTWYYSTEWRDELDPARHAQRIQRAPLISDTRQPRLFPAEHQCRRNAARCTCLSRLGPDDRQQRRDCGCHQQWLDHSILRRGGRARPVGGLGLGAEV